MVEELKNIMNRAEKLPNDQQKALAKLIEEELQWENTLASSQDSLSKLAKEALEDYKMGKTSSEDW
ncbi:hypothetical protein [Catalinimonas niigatensis]|uniref:hypothetical protein n=1 Tax=Catalinimonas niigatensis TaxID=1397264 RepID=UPI00266527F3|nr:hypothetical protein [Catalinimonas niigatensis]WPP48589.1 hypothetical protein PZB72_18120 [Catalinimonas niigatensis]